MIKQWLSFKLIGWREWGLECANRRDEERMVVVSVGQTLLAPIRLGLLHAGSFSVMHVLWEISSVYAWKFREISPTLVLVPGAYSKTKMWKQTNSSTGLKNQGAPKMYWNYNLISPKYLLKQGWINIASAWVCHAILIQNLYLPSHLNSAQWLTHLELMNFLHRLVHNHYL